MQRLDKWLFCTRLVRTRTGAARLVEAGRVRINGARALKPSRLVQPGDILTATPLGRLFVVRVLAAVERRGPASLARALYEDLTPRERQGPDPGQDGDRRKGARPTKRDRRRIDALRGGA
ncbi:MAG TPA: RNA-binding S4 domain-containing protein [Methyloceanibacter sp.]|jgi:ribosome-associated heat shock protein Hsp15|nr:RNA-binding S4 domain-containing protein [Methyloceanibacter sp.]